MKKISLVLFPILFAIGATAQQQPSTGVNIGQTAPEIRLPDINGDTISLSSLRGKVVFIDFWASWCNPCRKENPNVVKAYRNYSAKSFTIGNGFTVYGVSLDKAADAWKSAIIKDSLAWINVSDLKYWSSVAAAAYGISSIPSNLLIDKNGVIVAKNLRGPALEETLEKYVIPDPLELLVNQKKSMDAALELMKQSDDYKQYSKNIKNLGKKLAALQKEIDIIQSLAKPSK